MDEAVDEGDDAGGGGEHVGPLREGFIGRDEHGHGEVPAGDDLEEEVGIAVVVVEVSDLIDGQKLRAGEAAKAPGKGRIGVLGGELMEHVRGHGESGGEAVEDGVMEEVLHEHRLADGRGDSVVRTTTVTEWASAAVSRHQAARRLHFVHAFAVWMRAEDARHEVPPRNLFGPHSNQRLLPDLMTTQELRTLLTAALRLGPTGTISPLTWHYLLGLIASTGIRRCEAVALRLTDVTPHGLVIRESKFRKSRLVSLHPSTTEALDAYLAIRRVQATPDDHLFVLDHGRVPGLDTVSSVFRKLAIKTGIRTGTRRPRVHDLRHRFATRSLEALDTTQDPARHMLALATYLGHVDPVSTYWYLEASPVLLRDIAEAAERTFTTGDDHD